MTNKLQTIIVGALMSLMLLGVGWAYTALERADDKLSNTDKSLREEIKAERGRIDFFLLEMGDIKADGRVSKELLGVIQDDIRDIKEALKNK